MLSPTMPPESQSVVCLCVARCEVLFFPVLACTQYRACTPEDCCTHQTRRRLPVRWQSRCCVGASLFLRCCFRWFLMLSRSLSRPFALGWRSVCCSEPRLHDRAVSVFPLRRCSHRSIETVMARCRTMSSPSHCPGCRSNHPSLMTTSRKCWRLSTPMGTSRQHGALLPP